MIARTPAATKPATAATMPESLPRTVTPVPSGRETAPATFLAARAEEEARRGVRMWKFFAPGQANQTRTEAQHGTDAPPNWNAAR